MENGSHSVPTKWQTFCGWHMWMVFIKRIFCHFTVDCSWGSTKISTGSGHGWPPKCGNLLNEQIMTQLTHGGRMTHLCVSKLTIIGSDKSLSPGRRQAIIWTNVGMLLIWTLGTNFSEILSKVHTFIFQENAFKTIVYEMAAILSRPQCVKSDASTWWDTTWSTGVKMFLRDKVGTDVP